MKKALLLIDIQNDYFPGGKMELMYKGVKGTLMKIITLHSLESRKCQAIVIKE